MIRILHVVGAMHGGGIESSIMNIYRKIDRALIQFDFIIYKKEKGFYEDEIIELGGIIYRLPARKKSIISIWNNLKSLLYIIKKNKYLIVHRHSSNAVMVIDLLTAKAGGAKILIAHSRSSYREKKMLHLIMRPFLYKIATIKLAVSDLAGKWMYGNRKFIKLFNGIDINYFKFNIDIRNKYRKEYNINNKFVVGHIGKFTKAKNHQFLIEIFIDIYKENNNSILLLVGDGELRKNIETMVMEFGIASNCIFLGERSDVSFILQAMDVFIFPSRWEGLPNVVVEAQASGLHCVISNTITNEVRITNLVEMLSLDEPANTWAEMILNVANADIKDRSDAKDKIEAAGFDISNVVDWLTNYYVEAVQHSVNHSFNI